MVDLDWVLAIVTPGVESYILTEVMHPTPRASLLNHVLLDDVFDPLPPLRIGEVNGSKLNRKAIGNVRRAILIHDEVALFVAFIELVGLSFVGQFARDVREVRIDVDHGLDA